MKEVAGHTYFHFTAYHACCNINFVIALQGFYAAAKGIFKHIMAPNKHRFRDMLTKEVRSAFSIGPEIAALM